MADALGRSRAWLSDIETGDVNLNVFDFHELCRRLDVSPHELLGMDESVDERVAHLIFEISRQGETALRDAALALEIVLKRGAQDQGE